MPLPKAVLAACLANVQKDAKYLTRRLPWKVSLDELISAGNLGLAESIRRFDRGTVKADAFATYARFRIRGAMQDLLRKDDPLSRWQRDISDKLDDTVARMQAKGADPTDAAVASELGESAEYWRRRRAHFSATFALGGEEPSSADTPEDLAIEKERLSALRAVVGQLPKRLRFVVEQIVADRTLADIGRDLGVSESAASLTKTKAVALMRERMGA